MRVAGGIAPTAVPAISGRGSRGRDVSRWRTCRRRRIPLEGPAPAGHRRFRRPRRRSATCSAAIHAATADRPDIAARFQTDELFHALRLEPYLVSDGARIPISRVELDALRRDDA